MYSFIILYTCIVTKCWALEYTFPFHSISTQTIDNIIESQYWFLFCEINFNKRFFIDPSNIILVSRNLISSILNTKDNFKETWWRKTHVWPNIKFLHMKRWTFENYGVQKKMIRLKEKQYNSSSIGNQRLVFLLAKRSETDRGFPTMNTIEWDARPSGTFEDTNVNIPCTGLFLFKLTKLLLTN